MTVASPIGQIPEGWTLKPLKDLTSKIGSGATPRGGSATYLAKRVNYALIRSQSVHDRSLDSDSLSFIDDTQALALRGVTVQKDDLLLNITGDGVTFGRCCIVSDEVLPAVVNQHVAIIRPKPHLIISGYLLSYLVHPDVKDYVEGFNAGGSRRAITKAHIENFLIAVPPLPEQREIAAVLGALDDKIELNRKTAAVLEEMARALYRSWFVDFDPVWAKAEGRPPAHMDIPTAALFPDGFDEEGLPLGWQVSTIGEVAEIVGGSTPSTKEPAFWDGGNHNWATPRDLSNLGQPVIFKTDRKVTDQGLAQIGSGLSPEGTLLLSSRAPIGYLAIAKSPVAVNQGFIAIRATDKISALEAYCWCHENMEAVHANANGSTFQEISKKNFRPLPYVLASSRVRKAFNLEAGSLFERLSVLCEENQTLAALRDSLLPRLMSGELRVGVARELLDEVA